MISTQHFVVRPTKEGQRQFQKLGIDNEEDLVNPRVWSQGFDLRVTVQPDQRQWCMELVKLQYVAHMLTELNEVGVTALYDLSLDELLSMWSVEWIDGGIVNGDDVDLSPAVVDRLVAESKNVDPSISSEFERLRKRREA